MERCGKINASNSGSESWTGIGVVAGFRAVVLIRQWPHRRNREVTWCSELLQILQKVRGNGKTRNHLYRQNTVAKLSPCATKTRHRSSGLDTCGSFPLRGCGNHLVGHEKRHPFRASHLCTLWDTRPVPAPTSPDAHPPAAV